MTANTTPAPFTGLVLKLVGVILVVSSLLDYIILAIPFQADQPAWLIGFTGEIVDRGIIPLVGICFLLIGYTLFDGGKSKSLVTDLRLWSFALASLLGLIFLILVPVVYITNLGAVQNTALQQIEQGAGQAGQRLQAEIDQMNTILNNPESLEQLNKNLQALDAVIQAGEYQGKKLTADQLATLTEQRKNLAEIGKYKQDPKALEKRINDAKQKLANEKSKREGQAKGEARKRGIRTVLSSLLLSAGYITTGWLGLQGLSMSRSRSRG